MSNPEIADVEEHWPVEDSVEVYDGGGWVVRVRADRVRRPGHPAERPFTRVVVEHPGAAVVLAVDDEDRALCLWQYRHPVGRRLVQLPAGLLDVPGEEPAEVARRELREEAGLEASEWTHLATMLSSPGLTEERAHYFLARGLTDVGRGDFELEHEEAEMEVGWVPLDELRDAVLCGAVADAHVAIAVLTAQARGLTSS
ncbi:NUDIX hydrolase [Nocardioides sp. cx-169]|uniref:NUDIX domain-containing protein n=1 Tax=Nocardioides sp. cx-169 TaxID=2899080 RepID=UPI001E52B72A|nr:NUDIX hydrolase [Nocardioides sp. cx-169]MCD4536495.1 NUDIX hydrolase [Nocardioides sp. cx-169]